MTTSVASRLEFRILGPLEVVRAGERLKLRGNKQQKLLTVLLLNANRAVSLDHLSDSLWGEVPPRNPSAVLHVHISNLRRILGDENRNGNTNRNDSGKNIVTGGSGYALRTDPDLIDARRFERLAREGQLALASGEPHESWRLLTEALDLWCGPAFGDLAFEEFVQTEAVRLEELRMSVIEDRLEAALALGAHSRVVAELQSLVGANPLRERLRAQLMVALYRSGRQVDALNVYDAGRRLLSHELGIDPGPMLRSLHDAILRQSQSLDHVPTGPPFAPASFPVSTGAGAPITSASPFDAVIPASPVGSAGSTGPVTSPSLPTPAAPAGLPAPAGDLADGQASRDPEGNEGSPERGSANTPGHPRVELIGRDRELGHLRAHFLAAVAGRPSVVLIEGERGLGKTQLAGSFSQSCRGSAEIVRASCWEVGASPTFWPWTRIVRRLLERHDPHGFTESSLDTAGELSALGPELQPLLSPGEPASLESDAGRFRFYLGVTRLLVRLAADKPLVIVLDDVQWADGPSLRLLEFVAAELEVLAAHQEEARVLVLATYCETEGPNREPRAGPCTGSCGGSLAAALGSLNRRSVVSRLVLDPLPPPAVARFVATATGQDPSPELLSAFCDRSDGNPFFVQELVRHLRSKNTAADPVGSTSGNDRDAMKPEDVRKALPPSIRAVLRQRLAALPDELLRLLRVAAVNGRDFRLPIVARVCELDEERALEAIGTAVEQALVEEVPQRIGVYRFTHALVRDTLYADIATVERRRLHRHVGHALEDTGDVGGAGAAGGLGDASVFELADHFWRGAQAGNVATALAYAERAARTAIDGHAYEQAKAWIERALRLVPCLGPGAERSRRELPLQLELSRIIALTRGAWDRRILQAAERARTLHEQAGDKEAAPTGMPDDLLAAQWSIAQFHCAASDLSQAWAAGRRMLEWGAQHGDGAFELAGQLVLGMTAFKEGDLELARDHLAGASVRASLGPGRSGDPWLTETLGQDPRIVACAYLALVSRLLGKDNQAVELATDSIVLARQLGHPPTTALALVLDGWLGVLRNEPSHVRTRAEEVLALASRCGLRPWSAAGTALHGWAVAHLEQSRQGIEDGILEIQAALFWHREAESSDGAPFYLSLLAEAYHRAGRTQEALGAVDDALARSAASEERFHDPVLRKLRANLEQSG